MGWLNSPSSSDNRIWSVAELTAYVKELFDIDYRLNDVAVEGEISNFVRARSGHLYFTVKDAQSQLKCVMWRSAVNRLGFEPGNGDAVVVEGRVSIYEASGAYQLYAERMTPAGQGNLALAFEQLKAKLAEEGLFEPDHKQPIPMAPRKIGVVTSANAAALRDILNVLARRYPLAEVLIAPTLVQGKEAPAQIVKAIQWLDGRNDIDTIIVSRGGGSLEDLAAFNDEGVARAIFNARHPIIAGIGHEIDFSIADLVADLRAPTPSAAAELAVPDLLEVEQNVRILTRALPALMADRLMDAQRLVNELERGLRLVGPAGRLDQYRQRIDHLTTRLDHAGQRSLSAKRIMVQLAEGRLGAVSPEATLARGYAIVRQKDGSVVRSVKGLVNGTSLDVQLADGVVAVAVESVDSEAKG